MARMETFLAVTIMLMAVPVQSSTEMPECIGSLCLSKPRHYDQYREQMRLSFQKSGPEISKYNKEEDDFEVGYKINDDRQNCRSIKRVVEPYVRKGNETDLLVVQLDIFKQRITTTKCFPTSENIGYGNPGECFQDLALSWRGECKEKYTQIDLFVFNPKTEAIEVITSEVPVCCYCSIKME